jgi:hypothetical protein
MKLRSTLDCRAVSFTTRTPLLRLDLLTRATRLRRQVRVYHVSADGGIHGTGRVFWRVL